MGARIDPTMKIRAIAGEERTRDDKHFVEVTFKVLSRGQPVPGLTFGSVGIDTSAEDARRNAVDDWAILFADQYCAARAKTPNGLRVGPFVVYPSVLGLRGEHPGGWLENESERDQRIVDAVVPHLLPMEPDEIGMVDVKVVVRDAGRPEGQCFVNASLASAACERITSLPWPAGTYMYKQAFAYRTGR
jgi:hypothetical protein